MGGHPGQPLCAVRLVALADYVLGVVLSCCQLLSQLGVWGLWSWLTEAGACFRALASWLVALARILFEFFSNSFRIIAVALVSALLLPQRLLPHLDQWWLAKDLTCLGLRPAEFVGSYPCMFIYIYTHTYIYIYISKYLHT